MSCHPVERLLGAGRVRRRRMMGVSRYDERVGSPRKRHALELFAGLPGSYDWMGALMSFGQDRRWRRAMVATLDASPSARVLDVAAGTGLVTSEVVRRYGCRVVAVDQSAVMLSG